MRQQMIKQYRKDSMDTLTLHESSIATTVDTSVDVNEKKVQDSVIRTGSA